jgi:hypothetical protein
MRAKNNSICKLAMVTAAIALPFALAACSKSKTDEEAVAALDEKLIGKGSDPAMNAALDDRILIDPNLADSSNLTTVSEAAAPINGALPADSGYVGSTPTTADLADTKMLRAPKPKIVAAEDCGGCGETRAVTLGGLAKDHGVQHGKGACDAKLQYGAAWATRLPKEFPVYPKGRVKEAGGVEGGQCDVRVVSFTTSAAMQDVVDYYYSRARGAGFTADYEIRAGEHMLGGIRNADGGAYVVTFNRAAGGATAVDIVANNGV